MNARFAPACLLAAAFSFAGGSPALAAEHQVIVEKYAFAPMELRIKRGDTVTWVNNEKRVSHSVLFGDGSKKTLGLIYPGSFFFGTGAAEIMEVVAGSCSVRLKGETEWKTYTAGTHFHVPAQSGFDITVETGICEYICSFH